MGDEMRESLQSHTCPDAPARGLRHHREPGGFELSHLVARRLQHSTDPFAVEYGPNSQTLVHRDISKAVVPYSAALLR